MTIEKTYSVLKLLSDLDKKLGLQASLEAIVEALNNLVDSPAQPQHQTSLAQSLGKFTAAASHLTEAITPSTSRTIDEIGGENYFDPEIANEVRSSIQSNAMTPTVARTSSRHLQTKAIINLTDQAN